MGKPKQSSSHFLPLLVWLLLADSADLRAQEVSLRLAQARPDPHVRVIPIPAGGGGDRGGQSTLAASDECERLATSRWDLNRTPGTPSVDSDQIEVDRAERACTAAHQANSTDPRIAHRLGRVMYRQGNASESTRLFQLASDQGYAEAQNNLGSALMSGHGGLTRDEQEAVRLFRLAADQGDAWAQASLGSFCANGRGELTKDERIAARLYQLAAAQGHVWAQTSLGAYYATGKGGLTKDEREAARLYRLPANQGYAWAQYNLGILYELGIGGLPQDPEEAVSLFQAAARAGIAQAQQKLTRLGRSW